MNTVDVIVLVVILGFGIQGALHGLAWQLFRIGAWVLAFWLSTRYAETVGGFVPDSVLQLDATGRTVLGWAVIFVAVRLAVIPFTGLAKKLLEKARLSTADRSLGFLIGASKGGLLVALVLMVLLMFHPLLPEPVTTQFYGKPDATPPVPASKAVQLHSELVAPLLARALPPDARKTLQDELTKLATSKTTPAPQPPR